MQVNEMINASNFLIVGNQTGNTVSKETGNTDFSSFLEGAGQSVEKTESTNATTKKNSADTVSKKDSQSVDKADNVENDKLQAQSEDSVDGKDSIKNEETVKADTQIEDVEESSDVVIDSPNLSEEDKQTLLEAISSLLQGIMNQFGLNQEELAVKLEEFGMKSTDLMKPEGLKAFFLQINQADNSDLLINEQLNLDLQSFVGEMQEFLQTVQSVGENIMDAVTEEDLQMVFDDMINSSDKELQVQLGTVEETAVIEEPEVVITGEKAKPATNNQSFGESQKQTSTKQMQHFEKTDIVTAEKKQDTFENPVLQNIQNAVNQVDGEVLVEQPVHQTDVISQIVEQIKVEMNQNSTSMELQLYPEHLGRIQIQVISKDGAMTARIVAETEAAKQAIEGGLTNLKEAMQQQDLKVDAIEVMVSTMGFERGNEGQNDFEQHNKSKGNRKIDLSELNEDITSEEEVEIEKMKASGSSVSYTA